jgi:hypothetical protein
MTFSAIVAETNAALASGDAATINALKNRLDGYNNLGADLDQHGGTSSTLSSSQVTTAAATISPLVAPAPAPAPAPVVTVAPAPAPAPVVIDLAAAAPAPAPITRAPTAGDWKLDFVLNLGKTADVNPNASIQVPLPVTTPTTTKAKAK